MPQVQNDDPRTSAVRRVVYDYVEKGAFRQMKEQADEDRGAEFRFSWLSEHDRMVLAADYEREALVFRGILPPMPERVATYVAAFLEDRNPEGKQPAHRRVDPELGELFSETDEEGRTSVGIAVRGDRYVDGAKKLVNIMNEMIFSLQMRHADYVYTHFATIDE